MHEAREIESLKLFYGVHVFGELIADGEVLDDEPASIAALSTAITEAGANVLEVGGTRSPPSEAPRSGSCGPTGAWSWRRSSCSGRWASR